MNGTFLGPEVSSLLSKTEELRYIVKSANAAVLDISEYKLDTSVLEQEINIDN